MTAILQMLIDGIGALGLLIELLPDSPFLTLQNFIGENPAMEAVLWVVPIAEALAIFQLWVSAILLYYAVKVPLRWAKIVKS